MGVGTLMYSSPEQLYEEVYQYDCKVDIFAAGLVLFEMWYKRWKGDITVMELVRVCGGTAPVHQPLGHHRRRYLRR